jgi:hypothetical protein
MLCSEAGSPTFVDHPRSSLKPLNSLHAPKFNTSIKLVWIAYVCVVVCGNWSLNVCVSHGKLAVHC